MKTKSTLITILFLFFFVSVFSQNADFNGQWKINTTKSAVPTDQLYLSKITFKVKGDSLYTTRVYQSPDGQEYPFEENLTLNGKENKIFIYDMPRVSKAQKGENGAILIESKTTFNGNSGEENLVSKETWKLESGLMTQTFATQMAGQEFKGTWYYSK
jgi:hypothetical protein